MAESKNTSTLPEAESPTEEISQPVNAADAVTPVPTENHTGSTDSSDNPPAYTRDKQVPTTNPYPGYTPITMTVVPIPLHQLDDFPAHVVCPWCHTLTLTNVRRTNSSGTIITSVLCCLFCNIVCLCVPALMGWFQNIEQICGNPNCRKRIAYRPYGGEMQVETVIRTPDQSQTKMT
ncbi:hypothetical protein TSTA_078890 [Talaromyces stipitatus ATCC 10500]|uniref:LITAF domain-containing protein n=1 Tax=Talaromyces stipitatus (strain ATCC 10500 / CBS 375.48 / QM 6759 / NRRL 1006) TaxID=441959 RepID=B8LXN3_TALSN|nr:uncharacterized protein TSTA_078890 [Talaromyces stipitatus ATCC 10500]EED24534.1 hypothetical protein TSTA_078890 [Talaromyces stipitatus ATCC 10500]